jgi:hypothetical protein
MTLIAPLTARVPPFKKERLVDVFKDCLLCKESKRRLEANSTWQVRHESQRRDETLSQNDRCHLRIIDQETSARLPDMAKHYHRCQGKVQ